jgi:hypothetical protein
VDPQDGIEAARLDRIACAREQLRIHLERRRAEGRGGALTLGELAEVVALWALDECDAEVLLVEVVGRMPPLPFEDRLLLGRDQVDLFAERRRADDPSAGPDDGQCGIDAVAAATLWASTAAPAEYELLRLHLLGYLAGQAEEP